MRPVCTVLYQKLQKLQTSLSLTTRLCLQPNKARPSECLVFFWIRDLNSYQNGCFIWVIEGHSPTSGQEGEAHGDQTAVPSRPSWARPGQMWPLQIIGLSWWPEAAGSPASPLISKPPGFWLLNPFSASPTNCAEEQEGGRQEEEWVGGWQMKRTRVERNRVKNRWVGRCRWGMLLRWKNNNSPQH